MPDKSGQHSWDITFHGPAFHGCSEWLAVKDTNLPALASLVRLAHKHGIRFCATDFKDGDICTLKNNDNIVLVRGAASVVEHLLFKLDDTLLASQKLHIASDGDVIHG